MKTEVIKLAYKKKMLPFLKKTILVCKSVQKYYNIQQN